MPYVITTSEKQPPPSGGFHTVSSRRAVATLDEAQEAAWETWRKLDPMSVPDYPEHMDLTESGGTSTLPDGTVIEVERVDIDRLWVAIAPTDVPSPATNGEIIATYNAKQAKDKSAA